MDGSVIVVMMLLIRFVIPFGLLLGIGENARRRGMSVSRKVAGAL